MKRILNFLLGLLVVASFCVPQSTGAASVLGWEKVSDDGFGDVNNIFSYPVTTFNGWLIVGSGSDGFNTAKVMRSQDGTTWEQISLDGFGENVDVVYDFTQLNGFLYALTVDYATTTKIWRTFDMVNWEKIGDDPTGQGNAVEAIQMAVFNGDIYLNVNNGNTTRASVWKSEGGEDDWSEVLPESFLNQDYQSYSITTHNDHLYLAISTYDSQGARIYRSSDGTDWDWIIGKGYNNPANDDFYLWSMGGYLWAGTQKTLGLPRVYRSIDGLSWEEIDLYDNINSQTSTILPIDGHDGWAYFTTFITSMGPMASEIWRYKDGVWELYADKGFGDTDNEGLVGPTYYKGYMYAGTYNPQDGGSVWRKYIGGESTAPTLPETGANLL